MYIEWLAPCIRMPTKIIKYWNKLRANPLKQSCYVTINPYNLPQSSWVKRWLKVTSYFLQHTSINLLDISQQSLREKILLALEGEWCHFQEIRMKIKKIGWEIENRYPEVIPNKDRSQSKPNIRCQKYRA